MLRRYAWLLALALSLIILFKPGGDGPLPFPQADKVIHAVTFGLLALTASWRFPKLHILSMVLVAYAVGSEIIQHFWIPGREFDLLDIVADLVGAHIALVPTLTMSKASSKIEHK